MRFVQKVGTRFDCYCTCVHVVCYLIFIVDFKITTAWRHDGGAKHAIDLFTSSWSPRREISNEQQIHKYTNNQTKKKIALTFLVLNQFSKFSFLQLRNCISEIVIKMNAKEWDMLIYSTFAHYGLHTLSSG